MSHTSSPAARLWPLPLILRAELLLLAWLIASDSNLPITRLSLAVALLILSAGLTPVLLRPSATTGLAGSVGLLLAGIVLVPFDITGFSPAAPSFVALPDGAILRIVNGALLGPVLLQLTTVFPNPRPLGRGVVLASYLVSLGLLLGVVVSPAPYGRTIAIGLAIVTIGLIGATIVRLAQASRSSAAARLVLLGALAAEAPLMLRPLLALAGVAGPPYALVLVAQLILPVALALAIVRYDLFGIDAPLRRSLAYALASGGALAAYLALTVGIVALLALMLPDLRGIAAACGLLACAAAFAPLRNHARQWIDTRFYPERLRFAPAVAAAQAELGAVLDQATTLGLLSERLPAQIDAGWAQWIAAPAAEVASYRDHGEAWSARLAAGDQVFGRIWIGPRRSGLAYSVEERAQLDALAGQAALALANASLVEALRALNRDLEQQVADRTAQLLDRERALAALAERQRLARDLHDSVTQALFSLSLGARALRRQAERDPQSVVGALADQEATAQQALGEMRALLHQLRSPQDLSDQLVDLMAALRDAATAAMARDQIAVAVELADAPMVAPALAAELCAVTREALHNSAHHSGVREASLSLRREGDTLRLCVSDRGSGFDHSTIDPARLGVRGMRERIQALGGDLQIASAPGHGTVLIARVPHAEPADRMEEMP
jgi:signal transduction histidine kinase